MEDLLQLTKFIKMSKFACLLVPLAIILLNSCSKGDFSEDRNIALWTNDIPAQNRNLFQIRLAFGKTLAAALKDRELRVFLKQRSKIPGERMYEELVFALIKDEKLPSGKTVGETIKIYEDDEVKELFGEALLERVAKDDPMVAIKIPDVFYQYDWDTDNVIPFVGVNTPTKITIGPFALDYAFYYYNGYHELIQDYESYFYNNIKYFYVMVKYASDHVLINVNNMANEKNITLDELMPQVQLCKANILPDILKSGIRLDQSPNKIYLNLRTSFEIWYKQCSYKGEFLYDKEPCIKTETWCPRRCVADNPLTKNAVLTGFDIRKDLALFQLGTLFDESFIYSYFTFQPQGNTYKFERIAKPVRHVNLYRENVEVKVVETQLSANGATFRVPLVNLIYQNITPSTSQWQDINLLLADDLREDSELLLCGILLAYKDIVNPGPLHTRYRLGSLIQDSPVISAQYLLTSDQVDYGYCVKSDLFVWNYGIGVKY